LTKELARGLGVYTVGEVEERTGVPAASLRQWERRYGFPDPERSESGYRYYSEADLELIRRMRDLVADGVPPSRAAVMVREGAPVGSTARPADDLARELGDALIALDAERSERVLGEAVALHPLETVLLDVIGPAMVRIGDLWHAGEVSVATEHFASNLVQGRLRGLLRLQQGQARGRRVVVACAPGERHEIGALVLAILLGRAGFDPVYLGSDTPVPDLAALVREEEAEAVLLSATSREAAAGLRAERATLRELPALLVLGGAAFAREPELAAEVGGVFLGNDARKAVRELGALLAKRRPAADGA